MDRKTKRLIFLNAPYVLLGLFATKLGVVWRIAQGADFSEKMLHISEAQHGICGRQLQSWTD